MGGIAYISGDETVCNPLKKESEGQERLKLRKQEECSHRFIVAFADP